LKDIDDDAIRRATRILKPIAQDRDDRAVATAEAGVDYVAFGAFFPSRTKAAKHYSDPELIRDWSETTVVPCCAIGGITQQNCGPFGRGRRRFPRRVRRDLVTPRGPRAAVAELNEVFARDGRVYGGS
jgi:thiamine-phosphate pyrophosphorylase